jgi:hypothetical protein
MEKINKECTRHYGNNHFKCYFAAKDTNSLTIVNKPKKKHFGVNIKCNFLGKDHVADSDLI